MPRILIACHAAPFPTGNLFTSPHALTERGNHPALRDAILWLNETLTDFQYAWESVLPPRGHEAICHYVDICALHDAALFTLFHSDLIAQAARAQDDLCGDFPTSWYLRGLP